MRSVRQTQIIKCDACQRELNGPGIHFGNNHITIEDIDLCTECAATTLRELYSVQRINPEDIRMIIERGHYEFAARRNNAILC